MKDVSYFYPITQTLQGKLMAALILSDFIYCEGKKKPQYFVLSFHMLTIVSL